MLHQVARKDIGKGAEPTVAIMDSQSIKTSQLSHRRGFDDHKWVKGSKSHIVIDRLGIPLIVKVHQANLAEGKQAFELLASNALLQ